MACSMHLSLSACHRFDLFLRPQNSMQPHSIPLRHHVQRFKVLRDNGDGLGRVRPLCSTPKSKSYILRHAKRPGAPASSS